MKPHSELDDWIEFTRGWLDEEQRKLDECDAAAWLRFRAKLMEPING